MISTIAMSAGYEYVALPLWEDIVLTWRARSPRDTADAVDIDSKLDSEQRNSQKRKASPVPSQHGSDVSPKRAKLADRDVSEDGELDPNAADSPESRRTVGSHDNDKRDGGERRPSETGPDRRRNVSQEERKRGQRLFGGLLSTLSQTSTSSQQKKRLEVERRQHERAQQRRIEVDKSKAERLAKLTHQRKIEQVKLDEQVVWNLHYYLNYDMELLISKQMHTRHSNMLAMARHLQTRSEPKIVSHVTLLIACKRSFLTENTLVLSTVGAYERSREHH